MANTNSFANNGVPNFRTPHLYQLLNKITTIKLDRGNFLLRKNLALPILRSYRLEVYLSGEIECPWMFISQSASGEI